MSYNSFDKIDEKVLVAGGAVYPSINQKWFPGNEALLEWVKRGNTLVITKNADAWADFLDESEVVDYSGSRAPGNDWSGGNYFVREHPLFEGLPVNTAFNWEYHGLAQFDKLKSFIHG